MKRLLVLVPVVVSAGCIDLEGAFERCIDGGCVSATADAGLDAGMDAGSDAGFDAGMDAGPPPYDGGARCLSSPWPRLRCAEPLELSSQPGAFSGSLVRLDGGWLAGWLAPTVEVRSVDLDGGVGLVTTGSHPVSMGYFALTAAGDEWAAAWTNSGLGSCMDSFGAVSPVGSDAGLLDELAIAVNAQGGVALAGRTFNSDRLVVGQSSRGCPGAVQRLDGGPSGTINGAAVIWTSAQGGDGFRYLFTDNINAGLGSVNVVGVVADGGLETTWSEHRSVPYAVGATASVSGQTIFSAVNADEPVNATTRLEVSLNPADLGRQGATLVVDGGAPGWWNVGTCGAGCVSSVQVPSTASGPATVRFFSDALPFRERGTWDAVCSLPGASTTSRTSVSIAGDSQRVGVLVTTTASVKLYFCDVPPLD